MWLYSRQASCVEENHLSVTPNIAFLLSRKAQVIVMLTIKLIKALPLGRASVEYRLGNGI
jgi:hypothetical protein